MLDRIDRIQIATPDAREAARAWCDRVGAEIVGEDACRALGSRRITARAGAADVEFLQPDGPGWVADELARRGRAHLFAGGASAAEPQAVAAAAVRAGAEHLVDGDQLILRLRIEGAPVHFVISPPRPQPPSGLLDFLYEVTLLASDQAGAVAQIARTFELNPASFTTITSTEFGYTGVLTLFEAGRLDRFEVISPIDPAKTLGRYHAREGCSFYMAFAESAAIAAIERNARDAGAGITVERPQERPISLAPDQLWLHPPALGGAMLGVSRPSMAWRWSGHPERVTPLT